MQILTEIAMAKAPRGVFTRPEVACWLGGSPDRQFGLLKRAMAAEEVLRIRRGLYCLATRYLRRKVDPLALAQRIYGPSYISLQTALSRHGWIPEAVYAITSTSMERSREFETPVGRFGFTRIPQKTFYAGVTRVETEDAGSILLACPLKALADYVYVYKCDWDSARPVVESLRVDRGLLAGVDGSSFDRLLANYFSRRVRRFLKGLREDVIR